MSGEKNIQTLCAVRQSHTENSSAGIIGTENNKLQFSVIYLPDGLEELAGAMVRSKNITSGWQKKGTHVDDKRCRSGLESLSLKPKNVNNKPVQGRASLLTQYWKRQFISFFQF